MKPVTSIFLCLVLITVQSYKITKGSQQLIPNSLDISPMKSQEDTGLIKTLKRMYLHPYDIYEYKTQQGKNYLCRSYIFIKTAFTNVEALLEVSNYTVTDEEQNILYSVIPSVILIQSDPKESLELELLSSEPHNNKFVLKNSSLEQQNEIQLHFYSIQIHSYLYSTIREAKNILAHDQNTQNYLLFQDRMEEFIAQHENDTQVQLIEARKDFRKQFILQEMITNQTMLTEYIFGRDLTPILIEKLVSITIHKQTKWTALFDGLSLKYFSAEIAATYTKIPNHKQQVQFNLQLTSLVVRAGQNKLNKTLKQPVNFTNLRKVQFFDVCMRESSEFVLLGDHERAYIIDISNNKWHLSKYITDRPFYFQSFFFNSKCNFFGIHHENTPVTELQHSKSQQNSAISNRSNTITKIVEYVTYQYAVVRLEVPYKMKSLYQLNKQEIVLCWEGKTDSPCQLYQTNKFKIIQRNSTLPVLEQNHNIQLRANLNGLEKLFSLQVWDPKQGTQQLYPLADPIFSSPSSRYQSPFYLFQTYHNKSSFIISQMNKHLTQYLDFLSYFQAVQMAQLQEELAIEMRNGSRCYIEEEPSLSQVKVSYNQTDEWSVCSYDVMTSKYLLLKVEMQQPVIWGFRVYICYYLQSGVSNSYTDCQPLMLPSKDPSSIDTNNLSVSKGLFHSRHYKIYLIKSKKMTLESVPTLFIKDIERQQIQIASTIFFFIMLSLSFILIGLIFFIVMKNIIYNILVYYGHVNERNEPSYPLGWFSLKTKIKRMRQNGILKFLQYEPSMSDTEGNHCCFCLQIMKGRSVVAELYCGHQFHKQCFVDWIRNEPHARCPTCRRSFTISALNDFQNAGSDQQLPL